MSKKEYEELGETYKAKYPVIIKNYTFPNGVIVDDPMMYQFETHQLQNAEEHIKHLESQLKEAVKVIENLMDASIRYQDSNDYGEPNEIQEMADRGYEFLKKYRKKND